MIESRHTLSFCGGCGEMVVCADCGNNCCNASTGNRPDGIRCGCDEAYKHQAMFWAEPTSVRFAKDERQARKRRQSPSFTEKLKAEKTARAWDLGAPKERGQA